MVAGVLGDPALAVPEPERWLWHRFRTPEGGPEATRPADDDGDGDDDVVVYDLAEGLVHRVPGLSHWLITQWLRTPGPHRLSALVLHLDDPDATAHTLGPWLEALAAIGMITLQQDAAP